MDTSEAPPDTAAITELVPDNAAWRSPPISAGTTTGPEEIKTRLASMPYFSKAPISFAIHNPVPVGLIAEKPNVIFFLSAA